MHDENNNEESFIMISDSENIKKKAKEKIINIEIEKNIKKTDF